MNRNNNNQNIGIEPDSLLREDGVPKNHRHDVIFELRGMSGIAQTGKGKGSDIVAYSFDRCTVARSL